ncbi:MAG TPA: ammonia-forming cytochrome c nitrite reductase subunit c552 [Gemmataceae bacterium]|nr:ammonia-forming cytochrome c nitrite reductase subunit c552 [Gemmataceae bacterium]
MADSSPARSRWPAYLLLILVTAAVTFGVAALLMNIAERKREATEHYIKLVDITEDTIDPAEWGKNFPRQYDGYLRTADNQRSGHGGSDGLAPSKLEADPRLRRIFAGYAFSVDFRERRGHAYMLSDQDISERTTKFKQPGACLHCHASIIPAYRKEGGGDVMKGFEKVCGMPLAEARKLVEHPVACIDCHDPKSMQLRATRPGFLVAMRELAKSDAPLPHLSSIERWRKGKREHDYDVNADATRQEMRSFVCGQCHVEYYFKGDGKVVTYPWHNGLKMDQIESYYDKAGFKDWVHAETGAPVLKAQHPEFETWNQGVHARSGVACADCHMPYKREGAVKVSDHQVRSPMLNINRACQTCHRYPEEEISARVAAIQDRTKELMGRAEDALLQMMDEIKAAQGRGVAADKLDDARKLHRRAHWRVDFCNAENSLGFHAPQEVARILGEAIDFARQGQISALTQK